MSAHWEIRTASDGFAPAAPQALASFARIDPYSVWAHATHYRDLGGVPRGRVQIAIELKAGGETARQLAESIERNRWHDWIWMSALYRDPPPALDATRFCTAHVTRAFYAHLQTDLAGKFERFTETLTLAAHGGTRPNRLCADAAPLAPAPARARAEPGATIMGVCDDALAFEHRRYSSDAAGHRTRFQCVWNQNDAERPAAGLGYGSELLEQDMNAMLDDARLHAHMAGAPVCAFARDAAAPALDDAPPMIGVRLRQRGHAARDAFGPYPEADVLDAVRYIVRRAQDIGGAGCHALVSLSAGNSAWQQDGSALIEGALDELTDTGACSIVLPSGSAELSGCCAALTLAARGEAALHWPVRAHAAAPSLAEIWLSSDDAAPAVDVQIVPPDGTAGVWLTRGQIGKYTRGGEAICTVVHLGRGARGDGHMILVALAPTSARGGMRRAAAGEWRIRLRNNASASVTAHAWMQRDDDVIRANAGR